MAEIDMNMLSTLILLKTKYLHKDVRRCKDAIMRKLTMVRARREMFLFKWSKLSFFIQTKAMQRKDEKMSNFIEQVVKVPKSVLNHIAKCYVTACEKVY